MPFRLEDIKENIPSSAFQDTIEPFDKLGDNYKANVELEQKIDSTTLGSKDVEAFFHQATENNFVVNGIRALNKSTIDDRYTEDKEFTRLYDTDAIFQDLADNGLPEDDFERLSEAKSERHRLKIMDSLIADNDRRKFINETIGDNAKITAGIAGAVVDIDTLLVGPIASTLGKGGKIGKVALATAGVETTGAVVKSYMDEDYKLSREGLFDIAIGTFVDTSIAKMLIGRQSIKDAREGMNNSPDFTNMKWSESKVDIPEDAVATPSSTSANVDADVDVKKASIQEKIDAIDATLNKKTKNGNPVRIKKDKRLELERQKKELQDQYDIIGTVGIDEALAKLTKNRVEAEHSNFIETIKERQRARQKEIDDDKYYQGLEKKGEEYRKKHKQKIKDKEAKDKKLREEEELEIQRQREARSNQIKEALEQERKLREQREYYTAKYKTNARSSFYKMQDEIIKKAKTEAEIKKAMEFERLVNSLGDTVEQTLSRLGRMISNEGFDSKRFNEAFDIVKKQYPEDAKRLRKVENYINKHSVDDFDTKEILKALQDTHFPKLTRLQKAGIVAFITTGSAFAGDGEDRIEDDIYKVIFGALFAFVLAPSLYNKIKYSDTTFLNTVKESATSLFKDSESKHYVISGKGNKIHKVVDTAQKKMSTGFNSAYKGLVKKVDRKLSGEYAQKANKIIRDLLFNPIDGTHASIDVEKTQMVKEATSQFHIEYKKAYKEYRKIHKDKMFGLDSIRLERSFNNYIADMISGSVKIDNRYKALIDEMDNAFKRGLDDAIDVGVKGADNIKREKNYFPRIWKFTEIKNILHKVRPKDKDAFVLALSKGIKGKEPERKAELLVDWILKSNFNKKKLSDNTMAQMEEFLNNNTELSDPDLFELKKLLTEDTKISSRFKGRLEIDFSKVELPDVVIDGVSKKIELDDIVDRNVRDVVDSYANNLYGHIALSKRGYPSTQALRDEIDALGDQEIADELNFALDSVLNVPNNNELRALGEIMEMAKGVTFVTSMPFVAFSMAVEIAKTISNAGVSKTLLGLKSQLGMLDKDSLAFQLLQDSGGLGTGSQRARYDFRGIEQHSADETAKWTTTQFVKKAQQAVAKGSGLIDISDITQKANYLFHIEEFAKLVNNMNNGLVKTRLSSYGIDDDAIKMFKDDFKFNSKGQLLAFDKKGMSYSKRVKLNDIMTRLNQEITPEVFTGTLGLWLRKPEGKIFGFLLSYPLNLIENQAVKDTHFMDSRTLSNTILTFSASYLGMMAKYEALGREYEHETLVQYSLLNLPSFSTFSALRGMLDPAVTSTMADYKHDMEALLLEPKS